MKVLRGYELHPKAASVLISSCEHYWTVNSFFKAGKYRLLLDKYNLASPRGEARYNLENFYNNHCRQCPYQTFNLGNSLSKKGLEAYDGDRWAAAKSRGCPGGKKIIESEECLTRHRSEFEYNSYLVEVDIPDHIYQVKIRKRTARMVSTRMLTYQTSPAYGDVLHTYGMCIGNVYPEGVICWGDSNNKAIALASIREGYDNFWGSHFNSDLTSVGVSSYYEFLSEGKYLNEIYRYRTPTIYLSNVFRQALSNTNKPESVFILSSNGNTTIEFVYKDINSSKRIVHDNTTNITYELNSSDDLKPLSITAS